MKRIIILTLLFIPIIANGATEIKEDKKILQIVPFTSQAPFGNWKDLRQEDGCEEASALMAVKWAREQSLTKKEALKEIINISDFTLKKYKEFRNESLEDIVDWIFKDYFNFQNVKIKKNITLKEIISELEKGNLILAPMNGQLLHNPNYTQPGPLTHIIIVRGYDPLKKVFFTNDSGTRRGEMYSYDINLFFKAISAYPTGAYKKNKIIEKNVIIVNK